MANKYRKKSMAILVMVVAVFATYVVYDSYVSSVEMEFYRTYSTSEIQDFGGTCKLPDYDPFDPTILKYIKKWPPISCGRTQLPLTYLDNEGFIHINETAIQHSKINRKQFHCIFQEVKRRPNDDFHIELGPPEVLVHNERILYEFIVVQCYKNNSPIYESGHSQVRPLESELNTKSKLATKNGGINVFIMGLDSMSRLNFIRQLPKTYKILTKEYRSVIMKGLTKVGDNTFPNMMVMLSGLAAYNRDKTLGPFIGNGSSIKGNFDQYPIIWKNFSSQGYVTMYTEDQPEINTFNYHARGFHQAPTDYYTRPFWLALDNQKKFASKDKRCHGHVPIHALLWNYTEEFVNKMHKGRNAYFLFSFLNILSHAKLNSIQVVDSELAAMLKRLYSSGAMNNTMMLLLGDHGHRFDEIRKTVIGRVEERMPFLAIYLPKRLDYLRKEVEANSQILISWHDVYETIMDVATKNLLPKSKQVRFGYRGLSLFRPIPTNRTCRQVGIPEEYCVCTMEKELDPQEIRVMNAGHTLISHVNRLLQPTTNLCSSLILDTIQKLYSASKMANKYRKKIMTILIMVVAIFAVYVVYDSYVSSVEMEFYKTYSTSETQDFEGACKLPDYDPFDPSILKYIEKWPPISCGRTQLPLTYLDNEGFIHINETAIQHSKINRKQFHCKYQEVIRTPNDDFHIQLGPPEVLVNKEKIFYEFIVVQCYDHTSLIYESGHSQVRPLEPELDKKSKLATKNGGINVIMMGLDSMSRLNFVRQLPKTYKILTQEYRSVIMKGLTKVGDNTFPNMMVMLSGLAAYNRDETLGPFIGNRSASTGNFDQYPIIWKNFSSQGYVTMYSEDQPEINTFSYLAKGFYQPPTDYYARPFWLALDDQQKFASKDIRCLGHVPKHVILWNYTEQFVNKMHKGKNAFFLFSFLNILSHDKLNSIQVIDSELAAMLKRLYSSGAMNNTMMLLFGDHGNRFDDIRKTVIGRVEERMPFLAIYLPKRLDHLRKEVEANSQILISWHDVYETIMDVATKNLLQKSQQVRFGYRGLSLFRSIPTNRTCRQIGIPEEYCVCAMEKELDSREIRVIEAGQTIISHVNHLLKSAVNLCSSLILDTVKSAQLLLPPGSVTKPSDFKVKLRVTVKAAPSGALFEAVTERNAWDKEFRVVGDVNRINRYGNESACIKDRLLNMYCFCKTTTSVR